MSMGRILLPLLGLLAALLPTALHAEIKALVVASDYSSARLAGLQLANPVVDARMIEAALKRSAVAEVALVEEPDAREWDEAFDLFANSLNGDDVALMYFAGHGFQIDGANYFLASDGYSLIGLDPILQRLTKQARGVVFVVDACRNNPVSEVVDYAAFQVIEVEGGQRGLARVTLDDIVYADKGLAQVGNLRGLSALVFFSTEPGNTAEDGATPGKGSPFAKEFARQLPRRQSLDELVRKTAVAVNERTEGRQSPWRQGDLAFDVFIGGMRALPIP